MEMVKHVGIARQRQPDPPLDDGQTEPCLLTMCHANVRPEAGTSAPIISPVAGGTPVPASRAARTANHLQQRRSCRTAVFTGCVWEGARRGRGGRGGAAGV